MREMADDLGKVLGFLIEHNADEETRRAFDTIRNYVTQSILELYLSRKTEDRIQ